MRAKRLPWDYTGSAARTPECDADLTTEMARCQSPQGAWDKRWRGGRKADSKSQRRLTRSDQKTNRDPWFVTAI